MDILITGINGFVGSRLVEALALSHRIYGVDIVEAPSGRAGISRLYGWDELGSIPAVDVVIHLAAIVHDTSGRIRPARVMEVNTGLTRTAFDYFASRPSIGRFIYFSSCSVFSDPAVMNSSVIDEDTPLSPSTAYGRSKAECERYIHSVMDADPAAFDTRRVYILRPGMIHGPGNRGNLNLLYSFVRRGLPWPLGAFDNRRTFTSVANMQYAVGRLVDGDVPGGTYNLADDESVSTNELVALICRSLGRTPRVWHISPALVRAAVRLGDMLRLPLDSVRFGKLTGDCVVSNARLLRALGVDRMPVTARQGLLDTLADLRRHTPPERLLT